jgi:hypothetical protein
MNGRELLSFIRNLARFLETLSDLKGKGIKQGDLGQIRQGCRSIRGADSFAEARLPRSID